MWIFAVFFATIGLSIGGASSASASTGLTIQPIKISETMTAGQTISGTIQLTNASDQPVDVEVNLQDFIPVGGADSIQFVGRAEGVTSVKDWINVDSTHTFAFAVGETRAIVAENWA